jgi:hypothetical protein
MIVATIAGTPKNFAATKALLMPIMMGSGAHKRIVANVDLGSRFEDDLPGRGESH